MGYADRSGWMIECRCVIQVMNYVLDRSDFEEQIVRIIPKAENNSEHDDQSDAINDTARAI